VSTYTPIPKLTPSNAAVKKVIACQKTAKLARNPILTKTVQCRGKSKTVRGDGTF